MARLVVHIMGIVAPFEQDVWGEKEAVIDPTQVPMQVSNKERIIETDHRES